MMPRATSVWALAVICTLSVPAQAGSSASNIPISTTRARLARHASQLQRADDLASWVGIRAEQAQRLLRDSRVNRDDARAICLDEILSQLHAIERQSLVTEAQIREAAAADSDRRIGAHMSRMQVLSERSRQLVAKAEACGKNISRRVRMPTGYSVKMFAPSLPEDEIVRITAPATPPQRWRPTPRRWAGAPRVDPSPH